MSSTMETNSSGICRHVVQTLPILDGLQAWHNKCWPLRSIVNWPLLCTLTIISPWSPALTSINYYCFDSALTIINHSQKLYNHRKKKKQPNHLSTISFTISSTMTNYYGWFPLIIIPYNRLINYPIILINHLINQLIILTTSLTTFLINHLNYLTDQLTNQLPNHLNQLINATAIAFTPQPLQPAAAALRCRLPDPVGVLRHFDGHRLAAEQHDHLQAAEFAQGVHQL